MRYRLANSLQTLAAIFITLLIVSELVAYATMTPRPQEQFFQVYVLGSGHMAANYYPNDDTDLRVGQPVRWYLGVTDNMGSVQLVSVRAKIGNQTIRPPDDMQGLESPAPLVTEYMRFIQDNETWETPLDWSISNAISVANSTHILTLQLNNETYQLQDCSATGGYNFRLIFELWTYQTDTDSFQFGWTASGEHRVAWLQVWFNMTTPRPTEPEASAQL